MIAVTPRPAPAATGFVAAALALLVALLAAAVLFVGAGIAVHHGFEVMLAGALGSRVALDTTLTAMAPLCLTGLAALLALRIGFLNLGTAGQCLAGMTAARLIASLLPSLPVFALIPAMLLASALAGLVTVAPPLVAKLRRGGDEAIVALLMTAMVAMTATPLSTAMVASSGTALPDSARWTSLPWLADLRPELVLALVLIALAAAALRFTTFGFKLRATGLNAMAARFAGIRVTRMLVATGLLSGALAGLAGGAMLAGGAGGFLPDQALWLGTGGIIVAVLSGRSPAALVFNGFSLGAMIAGSDALRHGGLLPNLPPLLLPAVALMTALAVHLLGRYRFGRFQPQAAGAA